MHTFDVTLRRKALAISKKAIVARRLKRLPTILDKIGKRQPGMRLSRMQDIGGVHAIMNTVSQVYKLHKLYRQKGRFPHILKGEHDYISFPKSSGYRGIHLVYEFYNSQGRGQRARDYDGLLVEVQLRTKLQHEWATAVETVGTVLGQDLKSGIGDADWLELFRYISSLMAKIENQSIIKEYQHLSGRDLILKANYLIDKLDFFNKTAGWLTGVRLINEGKGSSYNILSIDTKEKKLSIVGFTDNKLDEANRMLAQLEQDAITKGAPEPVLVAAGDAVKLRKAYPNYFLDMQEFVVFVHTIVEIVREDNV